MAILQANRELGPGYDEHTADQIMELLRQPSLSLKPWQQPGWESEETFESAGKVLWSAFQRQGLNPQATLDTLRVKRIRSEYTRSPF